jgi:hypothetical protein
MIVTPEAMTANRLIVVLCAYFIVLMGTVFSILLVKPELLPLLPIGGNDVMEIVDIDPDNSSFLEQLAPARKTSNEPPTTRQVGLLTLYLGLCLGGTIFLMLPVTWTYAAIKREVGYRKSFTRALIVLPIVATTTVLLIQDNLALAFGLAAMVAAVRFRVALQEAIDGIFVFASICVGLAAGIGNLGVASIMALIFCLTNAFLWKINFGRNPIDDQRLAKKRAKFDDDD